MSNRVVGFTHLLVARVSNVEKYTGWVVICLHAEHGIGCWIPTGQEREAMFFKTVNWANSDTTGESEGSLQLWAPEVNGTRVAIS